ncbi:MAG: class I SAM-dependent methyltransferase [Planctomycetota bacterium]|nr:class I SAM-dependent methyltransferase [Planctomycetota bacterium]MDA1250889.1 class I SAM-dependent methyltransferase [Planctomycetota bacterium]
MILSLPGNPHPDRHPTAPSGVSRSLMRELILSGRLGPGSRVLIVGCGDGELAERLIPFGIQVTGVDEVDEAIDRATRLIPEAEFQSGVVPRSHFDDTASPFDSVVVLASSDFRRSLRRRPALRTTAGLLSGLRPGGQLHFVLTGPGGPLPHEAGCLSKMLRLLPGTVMTSPLVNQKSGATFQPELVRLQLDAQKRTALEWDQLTGALEIDSPDPCCRFCPIQLSFEPPRAA